MPQDTYTVAEDCRNGDPSRQSQSEVRLLTLHVAVISALTHSTRFQAAPPSQYLGCVPPWRDSQYTGTQGPRYEAPRIDRIPSGYDPRRDLQCCNDITFPPASVSLVSFIEILLNLTNLPTSGWPWCTSVLWGQHSRSRRPSR